MLYNFLGNFGQMVTRFLQKLYTKGKQSIKTPIFLLLHSFLQLRKSFELTQLLKYHYYSKSSVLLVIWKEYSTEDGNNGQWKAIYSSCQLNQPSIKTHFGTSI